MTQVTLYGKAGCTICDEARGVIRQVRERREFELREVDISLDPALHGRYGERIPVIEIDGEVALELIVDVTALERALDTVGR